MSDTTKIEWATATWNPWEGCTKVSPGCAHCYAAARNHRFGMDNWGAGKPRRRTSAANWKKPLAWNRAWALGTPRPRIFPSLCDWLDDEVPVEWLADFLRLIHATPNLDWLLLTKRPENWLPRLDAVARLWACDGSYHETPEARSYHEIVCPWRAGKPPQNVWLGVSVEDQVRADERIPELMALPAKVRFLSVEPLLEALDLAYTCFNGVDPFGTMPGIHWVIVGGESGPGARPCNVQWIRSLVGQCHAAGVPCYVKQLGSNPFLVSDEGGVVALSEAIQLNHPKGGDPAEWPEHLRVREFPR